ncbi:MAG: tetratricopeptide repeat protein [candidate division WOR-3 bacterium]|nr:tetratricopeptide repeat protein [candidate division WOR-3 bacterium]
MPSQVLWVLDQESDGKHFERLCTDLLFRNGYKDIVPVEPQDGGRDAKELPRRGRGREGETIFFQFSLEKNWKAKLRRDARKLKAGGYDFSTLVFVTNQKARGVDQDKLGNELHSQYGWKLFVFSREWLRLQLEEANPDLAKKYLGIDMPSSTGSMSGPADLGTPVDAALKEAWAALESHRFDRAVALSKAYLDKQPESPLGWQALAWSQYSLHQYDDALASVNRARKLKDTHQVQSMRACILAEKGIREGNRASILEAKLIFERLLQAGPPDDWRQLYNLANTLSALGEYPEAIKRHREALELERRNPTVWKNLASAYHQVGDHANEMTCFDRALELDPLLPEALASKGISLLVDFDKPKEASSLLKHALGSDPQLATHWPRMWFWLAEAHRRSGSPREALHYVEDGLAHQPGNLALDRLKSALLAELTESAPDVATQARDFWKGKLSTEPRDYEARSRLVRLEMQTGNEPAAWGLLEECFGLMGLDITIPLGTSSFTLDECVVALEFLPLYVRYRKSYPVSDYWMRTDPLYDLPFPPPVTDGIQGALTTFLAVPFGLGVEDLETVDPPRTARGTLIGFFDALRPLLVRAISEGGRELATLVPKKELGVDAAVGKTTDMIMFLGLVALREFGRQRGWIAGRFQIPGGAVNDAMNGYDEAKIHGEVLAASFARINREIHLVPD